MKIRALIVDDEELARGRLQKLLGEAMDFEVIGELSNGAEAISFIRERRPDLVFLDVHMPEMSGFDVLRALPVEMWPVVVFVTAHHQHAIEAFAVQALDYVLKPYTQARLWVAVQRARQQLEARRLGAVHQELSEWLKSSRAESSYLRRIAVKTGTRTLFIRVEDVDYIESAGNYAVVVTGGENHILRDTLTNLEARLPPELFLRISRSVLVNLECIKAVETDPVAEYVVVLQDDRRLSMTRGFRELQERVQYTGNPLNVRWPRPKSALPMEVA